MAGVLLIPSQGSDRTSPATTRQRERGVEVRVVPDVGPSRAGPVFGVGVEVASVLEVRQSVRKFGEGYLSEVFTANEISSCPDVADASQRLAAMLAAKEASLKVLASEGVRPPLTSVEVQERPGGGSELFLKGPAAAIAARFGINGLALTLSYDGDLVTAVVIATRAQ